MKKPKLSDLKIDERGTKKMRSLVAHASKIKITVNIDTDIIKQLKSLSEETSIPYQVLLNKLLKESLEKTRSQEARLRQLEETVAVLRKKVSA